jgi:hypothetical protein
MWETAKEHKTVDGYYRSHRFALMQSLDEEPKKGGGKNENVLFLFRLVHVRR